MGKKSVSLKTKPVSLKKPSSPVTKAPSPQGAKLIKQALTSFKKAGK